MQAKVDRFGRIVIPKSTRDNLGILPGTVLRLEEHEDEIVLTPLEEEASVEERDGVLVYTGEVEGDLTRAVATMRERRSHWVGKPGRKP